MLEFLRRYSSHWVIGLIIFAIAAVFVLSFGFGGLQSGPLKEVAVVNGDPILITSYLRQYNQMLKQYQERSRGELTEEMVKAMHLKEMALNRLIDETLLLQGSKRLGLTVSDAELRQHIENYPFFQRNGKFDEKLYFMLLARNHLNSADFESQERHQLQLRKILEEVGSLAKVSDAEAEEMFHLEKDAVQVSYIAITPDRFMAGQHPTEADLAKYYQEHREEFRLPARARVSYLVFHTKDYQDQAKPSAEEVADYLSEHSKEYRRPKVIRVRQILFAQPSKADSKEKQRLSKEAQELLKKLRGGADFAQVAKAQSKDPASREKGGELGYVQRGQHPPEWDRVAFSLKPGQVGRADTPRGIYLLKVEEVKETEPVPDAEARVTQILKRQKAQELAQEAAKVARTAFLQDSAAELTKKYGASLKQTPWIAPQDQVPGLGKVPVFNQTAIQLKTGEVSRVVNLPGGFAVMKSLEYQADHIPPLKQCQDRVAQAVKKRGALKEAEKEANRLLAQLKKGETLAKVAAAAKVPVKESRFFTRFEGFEGQRPAEVLTSAAFILSKEHPYTDHPIPWQDQYYLLAFKERRPGNQAEFLKVKPQMTAQYLEQKKQMLLASWLEAERRQAKIKVFELP
jgi:peptidyl-prolyl cis-trans isomerase D